MAKLPRAYALLFLPVIGALLCYYPFIGVHSLPAMVDGAGQFYFQDFINYWGGPHIAVSDPASLFDKWAYTDRLSALHGATLPTHNWSYPLHALPLLWPFGLVPLTPAFLLWAGLGLALYGALLWKLAPPRRQGLAVALGLLAPASIINLYAGQNGFYCAVLFVGAAVWLRTHPARAGIALGLLTLKPQLGLIWPILLLRLRAWRSIAVACATVLLLVIASARFIAPEYWGHFFTHTVGEQGGLIAREPIRELYETMMPVIPLTLQRWGVPMGAAFAVQAGVSLMVAVQLWRLAPRLHGVAGLVFLAASATLVTPYLFNYDLTLLSAALVLRLVAAPVPSRTALLVYGLGYLLPVLTYWGYHFFPVAPAITLAVWLVAQHEIHPRGVAA